MTWRTLRHSIALAGILLMAGRSATFYLGGQPNAQAAVETGLVFNPSSLSVDNNGPQTIAIDNPPVVIPPYTVGRIIPVTLQSNRIKAVATGLSNTGKPAALTWYEDAQPPASGNSVQAPFTPGSVQQYQWVFSGTGATLSATTLVPPGNYAIIGMSLSMIIPTQNAVGLTFSGIASGLAINGVYSPFAAITFPAPLPILYNGNTTYSVSKSDGTTNTTVLLTAYLIPAAT